MPKRIREIRIEGNIAYVPLTKGHEAIIDAADVHLVKGWNWCALVTTWTVYAHRCGGPKGKQKSYYMHRILMGDPKGLEVDHIDGNGINNRRSNLREATKAQNRHNQRVSIANSSGYKGVSWHKSCDKWHARIKRDGKSQHLGLFKTAEAAHAAYCRASAEIDCIFGRLS